MKDKLIWHYLTKRSDDIQVGDYYCFSNDYDILIQGETGTWCYLIKIPLTKIVLMRLKGKTKEYVWQAIKKSKRKKHDHYRVQGKYIRNLSNVNLYKEAR